MARPEALLFDFGNVLVHIDFDRVCAHWARAAGVPVQHVASRFTFDAAYEAHERGELEAPAYFHYLRHTLAIDIPDADFLEGWNAVFIDPIGGIEALLDELAARWPLYLFSNTNRAHHQCLASRYARLLARFRGAYFSYAIGWRKPDPKAYVQVAALAGIAPERFAFFDDLAENVEGARAAGMSAFQVASVADIRRALGIAG